MGSQVKYAFRWCKPDGSVVYSSDYHYDSAKEALTAANKHATLSTDPKAKSYNTGIVRNDGIEVTDDELKSKK